MTDHAPTSRAYAVQIFLIAFAALLLEIGYTRVFSFKISSYYTYLILGLALLGTGGGAVFVALSDRLRRAAPQRALPAIALLGAGITALGYPVVAAVELSTSGAPSEPGQVLRLTAVSLVLSASFLAVGLVIALIFASRSAELGRLYAADLAGAGLGCAAAIPVMLAFTPPGSIFAAAAALALSAVPLARGALRGTAVALAIFLALGCGFADRLPDPVVDPAKTMGARDMERWQFESRFRRWHPVFRVDVLASPLLADGMALVHDGDWGSALWANDGSEARRHELFAGSSRALPFNLIDPDPRVLIIGAAGGIEILASLHYGASEITAVELNPVTVSLHRDHFADFTGRLAFDDRVHLVAAEGRAFLARDASRYDLIYFVAPDSYASMNAQASGFVLAESYLYTEEMVVEALGHLNPGGVLCMLFGEVDYRKKPNRTARYLATARSAFASLGLPDFSRHVMLATNVDFPLQASNILLSREPFTREQQRAFQSTVAGIPQAQVRHLPLAAGPRDVPNAVITLPPERLEGLFASYAYDIRPVTDDAPFFWHFARFRDLLLRDSPELRDPIGPEDGRGEVALLVMFAVATALAMLILLTPFFAVRARWSRLPARGTAVVYFSCLGLGFMFYEVCLIQKLTLFLGYPTYTLTVTLFALLLFSGLGSLVSERYAEGGRRALPRLVAALLGLTLFYQFGIGPLVAELGGQPLALRVLLTVVLLAPLGLCLGAFMPLGLRAVARISERPGEYVAWCWAVNGVFSVMASILGTMLSMSYGFRVLLLLAAGLYVLAGIALRRLQRVEEAPLQSSMPAASADPRAALP